MTNAPFLSSSLPVEADWIDYNGHLNMAYYNVLFDRGVDQVWERFGFGPDYRAATGCTTFSAEFHVCYLREIHLGDAVTASFHLLDHTDKALHFYQELIHPDGWISATGEGIALHVDQSGPSVVPIAADILSRISAMREEHSALPFPDRAQRVMKLRR
ncbi:thioesterase family protein [Shimia abyssi]|uniref:Acyl-CoA thioester hydrolase n=1 Tax=Shimia abyssi TaxID=1662395 RepID=A0A2P8FJJ9_9RHOB|nr:thioesterase family protein [Shimia abyssi]PSL21906.1 acyl-CoA thioester hydrolase [Shimia abyssi]